MDTGELLGQVGVAGILIVLVLRMVFDFLKAKKEDGKGNGKVEAKVAVMLRKMEAMEKKIEDLHLWHAKTDPDGVPVWYVRRSLEEAVLALTGVLSDVKNVLADLSRENKEQTAILREIVLEQGRASERLAKLTGGLPRLRADSQGR
jgi:hypothetical protein